LRPRKKSARTVRIASASNFITSNAPSAPVKRKFGWVKDAPDKRDQLFSASAKVMKKLPKAVDLRAEFPAVYNQGDMNSCTSNAIAAAIEFDEIHQKMKEKFVPSRLFIYYNERAVEGTVDKDAGGQIRDGIKSVANQGVPHEKLWGYDKKILKVKPKAECYSQAKRYKTVKYLRMMHHLDELKSCLASGFPFVFGIKVYASFQSQEVANSGVLQMPKKGEKVAGLHAIVAVGYDDSAQRFIVRNSFGKDWGMNGYFTIPYAYLLDPKLAHDFWTLRLLR
jgi:C1A family cysteine protease